MNRHKPQDIDIQYARHEGKRIQELKDEGLCLDCGDNPQNPALSGHVCLDCWESTPHMGCDIAACPNSTEGHFRQGAYCKKHLIDIIHKNYEQYLKNRSNLKDTRKELEQRAEELDVNIEHLSTDKYTNLSSEKQDLVDDWHSYKYELKNLHHHKSRIKKAMSQCEDAIPDGYEIFG